MARICKSVEKERLVVSRSWGAMEVTANGYRVYFWNDEKRSGIR